jgi:hypothetical protein
MAELHETVYGKKFFSSQLPELIKAINRNAEAIEESNRIERSKEAIENIELNSLIPAKERNTLIGTKKGTLVAVSSESSEYPGIYIELKNGDSSETIALIEQDPFKGIRTLAWNKNKEDYINETIWSDNNEKA